MSVESLDPRELASISDELNKMFETDQKARENNNEETTKKIDQENTQKLKEIITSIGWPTESKVGEDPAHYAWLLVQHADQDIEFQKNCLRLMKAESPEEVQQEDIAYLEDRILVAENKPQLYGSQWKITEDGSHIPEEIFEPDKLDERRAKMGMKPFAKYVEDMKKAYETWKINKKIN